MRERIRDTISGFAEVEITAETKDGTETLTELHKQNTDLDLAIIDIRMPGINGLEVLSGFRSINNTTEVIMLTNFSSEQYRERAIKAGADYFFSKSEDFDKIQVVISKMLKSNETI